MKQLKDMSDRELFTFRDNVENCLDHLCYSSEEYLEKLDEVEAEITRRDEK